MFVSIKHQSFLKLCALSLTILYYIIFSTLAAEQEDRQQPQQQRLQQENNSYVYCSLSFYLSTDGCFHVEKNVVSLANLLICFCLLL
jgi:hypothetical protein